MPRVLQVEPCRASANCMQLSLSEMGVWVDTVHTGAAALALLEKRPSARYDLLLLDVDLGGGLSAFALASCYRAACKRARRKAATVVVLSAELVMEDYEQFGVDYWLQRPLSARCVAQLAAEWLERMAPAK